MMYPKLFTKYGSKPPETTEFYDYNDELIPAVELIGKKCKLIATVKVKNIYVGVNLSIQLKVDDAIVVEMMDKKKRMLKRLCHSI